MTFVSFDRKRLAQDTLSAISQFGACKKFVGHDGREYAVVSGIEKSGSESFIDVGSEGQRCGKSGRQIRGVPDRDFPAMSAPASASGTLFTGQAKDGTVGLVHVSAAVIPASKTLMTLQETAEYLRVTRSTIHRLLKRNQIPAFRIGRHWRFSVEEIDNWFSCSIVSKEPEADV